MQYISSTPSSLETGQTSKNLAISRTCSKHHQGMATSEKQMLAIDAIPHRAVDKRHIDIAMLAKRPVD
eukprot:m.226987 g.226987  ORF g.226987 m.226987 type:complete len:68 (+) comp10847_c1_seq23:3609-3812(+)